MRKSFPGVITSLIDDNCTSIAKAIIGKGELSKDDASWEKDLDVDDKRVQQTINVMRKKRYEKNNCRS
jgi:hypothetical protein